MTRVEKPKNLGNLITPFTGCAQIYHQRWYVRSPRGKFHLHGLLRRAVRQRQAHMGELQSPIGAKVPPLPLVNFAFRQKPKCGFYLPTKSMSAPRYPIGRM